MLKLVPHALRGLVGKAVGVLADGVPRQHPAALIEEQHIHTTAHEQRQLGAARMPVRAKVRITLRHDEKTLHRIGRGGVDVVVRAGTRARRSPGGELIEERMRYELQHSGCSLTVGLVEVGQERRE